MKEWFDLPEEERQLIFEQTGTGMGIPPRAVEKDWWGMAVLRAINGVDYLKLAKPLLNFIPPESEIEKWKKDYQDMCESMIYGESDSFDVLISKLKELNARVNQTK